ncbi:MAG TPA: helix-turn-helix domain-containing protein [Actinomycetes bacterium]|jgi:excisionase family DNA binding protein|nr:helix-turn-helix domain-containing protein [Actinomycetes bacterium]
MPKPDPSEHQSGDKPLPRPPRLVLTPEEAAHALGISRSKLYELLRAGAIESIRRSRRIPIQALRDFVERLRLQERGA